jgi:hypothetical protein
MTRWWTHLFADRDHRPTDGEAHNVFEGRRSAVDDRHTSCDAASLDLLAVVAAEAGAARVIESETAATDGKMTAVSAKGTLDVFAVIPQNRIVGFAHCRISV